MTDPHPFDLISIDELRAARAGRKWTSFDGLIGAFVAEMDFGVAPVVAEALHNAIDQGQFGYVPDPLVADMAEACADWQRERYGWEVSPEAIHAVPDVLEVMKIAIDHFAKPGAVVIPTPAYMPFLTVTQYWGHRVIEVPMRVDATGHHFDLDALASAFVDGGTLLVLCNPLNPVGTVFERDELQAVSEVVEAAGARVFADEIHAPFVYDDLRSDGDLGTNGGARHVPYASISPMAAGHSITGTSASKAWNLPGLKCAQLIVTNPSDAVRWASLPHFVGHGTSTLGVVANTAAYRQGGEWFDGVLDYLDDSRHFLAELVAEHLPAARYRVPDGTYLAWLDLRDCGLGPNPAQTIRDRAGVAVIDGAQCGEGLDGFVRLNFATPRPILRTIIERIATSSPA